MDYNFIIISIIRLLLSVIIGSFVGSERARHGRAAGMRTHILVCLGACMTSLTALYVIQFTDFSGDVFRIPAQVISGVGFLGAGMIIKNENNTITGLTTAAGVWATASIGLAVGFGYYVGAVIAAGLLMITLIFFSRFEKNSKNTMVIYVELDDAGKVNTALKELESKIETPFKYSVFSPKTEKQGNVGINLIFKNYVEIDKDALCKIDGVLFAVESEMK